MLRVCDIKQTCATSCIYFRKEPLVYSAFSVLTMALSCISCVADNFISSVVLVMGLLCAFIHKFCKVQCHYDGNAVW